MDGYNLEHIPKMGRWSAKGGTETVTPSEIKNTACLLEAVAPSGYILCRGYD